MVRPRSDAEQRKRAAEKALLDYFVTYGPAWPGGDSLTTADVVAAYQVELGRGKLPGIDELVERHPTLSSELQRLLGETKV